MAKFSLYASSPDGLAQQQMAMERYYTGTAEGNRAANMDAQRFNIQAMIQAQQADEVARANDNARAIESMRYQAQDAENRRRFDMGQSLAANERAKAEEFQRNFIIPDATQRLEAGKLNLQTLKEKPMRDDREKVARMTAFIGSNPEAARIPVESIAGMFDVKPEAVKPFHAQADSDLAINDAARLNAALNARLSAMTKTGVNQAKIEITPELVALAKKSVEAEAGKVHGSVKFNPATGYWQAGAFASEPTQDAEVAAGNWAWSAQPQTTTALPMGSSFGAPVVAAPPALVPQSQYIQGRRYGNLRYLGGDINAESSWAPAN